MKKLILHPTETSQWHALVNEAQAVREIQLNEDLESYLVFLLMRFSNQPEMVTSVLALDFLKGHQLSGVRQQNLLRDVGDKCLLFSGLFPDHAEHRSVKVSYFIEIGQTAYNTLSNVEQPSASDLFAELCDQFILMMDLLRTTRKMNNDITQLFQFDIDTWQKTEKQSAKKNFSDLIIKKRH